MMSSSMEIEVTPSEKESRRNLLAFFIAGLCNYFGYVVMLSAAFDILKQQGFGRHNNTETTNIFHNGVIYKNEKHNMTLGFHCNPSGTGLILLADIVPGLMLKLTAPMYIHHFSYHIRFGFMVLSLSSSLLVIAFSNTVLVSILAVCLASISGALGEISILSLSSYYKKSSVIAWSSGTGVCAVVSSLAYAGLLQLGLTQRSVLLSLLVVPCLYTISIWFVLEFPKDLRSSGSIFNTKKGVQPVIDENGVVIPATKRGQVSLDKTKHMSMREKLKVILGLRQYMIPLFLVYFAEYTINQGLYELLYYPVSWLSQAQQYRWFQVTYQVSVCVSRCSILVVHIRKVLVLSLCQYLVFAILFLDVYFTFIPYIWITLALAFIEGLIGGAVYANTFFRMSEEVDADVREFSMGAASVSDACGIALAGVAALPLHTALCTLKTT